LGQKSSKGYRILVEFDREISKGSIQAIAGVLKVTRLEGQQWELYSEQNSDIRPEIFKFAVDQQLTVLTINRIEQDLESIFRQLTAKK